MHTMAFGKYKGQELGTIPMGYFCWCLEQPWLKEPAKARIIAESFAAGANVSAVARRHGLLPQQVYAWRRLARSGSLALLADEEVEFAPIVATGGEAPAEAPTPSSRPGSIEIELGGTVIRVTPGTDWRHLRDVLRAVRASM